MVIDCEHHLQPYEVWEKQGARPGETLHNTQLILIFSLILSWNERPVLQNKHLFLFKFKGIPKDLEQVNALFRYFLSIPCEAIIEDA